MEAEPTGPLSPQDAHLMPKGDDLQFQGSSATKAEKKQRNDGGKNRQHSDYGKAASRKTLDSLSHLEFEQAQLCLRGLPQPSTPYFDVRQMGYMGSLMVDVISKLTAEQALKILERLSRKGGKLRESLS